MLFPRRLYNHWPGTQRKALIEFVHCKVAVLESTSQDFLGYLLLYMSIYVYMHIYHIYIYIYISWLFGDTPMFFGENTYCISEFDEAALYRIWHVQKHVQILIDGFNPPEKYDFVSWEYSSQYVESHKIPWFQITNQNMFNGDSGLQKCIQHQHPRSPP